MNSLLRVSGLRGQLGSSYCGRRTARDWPALGLRQDVGHSRNLASSETFAVGPFKRGPGPGRSYADRTSARPLARSCNSRIISRAELGNPCVCILLSTCKTERQVRTWRFRAREQPRPSGCGDEAGKNGDNVCLPTADRRRPCRGRVAIRSGKWPCRARRSGDPPFSPRELCSSSYLRLVRSSPNAATSGECAFDQFWLSARCS